MTQELATWVERELEIKLPEAARHYLSNFPFTADMWIMLQGQFYTPQEIVKTNTFFRAEGFFERECPHNFLAIGGDGVGNEYFINADAENTSVCLAEHERSQQRFFVSIEHHEVSQSLAEWVEKALEFERTLPEWAREQIREAHDSEQWQSRDY